MRESVIERYLVRRVKAAGGECRKLRGRRNEPDRLVILPHIEASPVLALVGARIAFVETKATHGRLRPGQIRELTRLRRLGCSVWCVYSKDDVDSLLKLLGGGAAQ